MKNYQDGNYSIAATWARLLRAFFTIKHKTMTNDTPPEARERTSKELFEDACRLGHAWAAAHACAQLDPDHTADMKVGHILTHFKAHRLASLNLQYIDGFVLSLYTETAWIDYNDKSKRFDVTLLSDGREYAQFSIEDGDDAVLFATIALKGAQSNQ